MLETLSRCGGPAGITKAGRRKLTTIAKAHAPRIGDKLVEAIMTALGEQTATAPGTAVADTALPRLADSLKTVLQQRKQVVEQVEGILDVHPLAGVLTSMPGIGVRTAARILLEVGDASNFASSGQLAAYADVTPATRISGTSIKGAPTDRQPPAQMRVLPGPPTLRRPLRRAPQRHPRPPPPTSSRPRSGLTTT